MWTICKAAIWIVVAFLVIWGIQSCNEGTSWRDNIVNGIAEMVKDVEDFGSDVNDRIEEKRSKGEEETL
jgi:hypothetical protein